jgi:hypothetical protein
MKCPKCTKELSSWEKYEQCPSCETPIKTELNQKSIFAGLPVLVIVIIINSLFIAKPYSYGLLAIGFWFVFKNATKYVIAETEKADTKHKENT